MSDVQITDVPSFGSAPESAREAVDWIASHDARFGLVVDGNWRPRASKSGFDSINPSNGRPLANFAQASSQEVDEAVHAAERAFERWSRAPGRVRADYLERLAQRIERHAELFALLESLESGKPIREARAVDVPQAARILRHFAGWARLCESEFEDHEAAGVVAALVPWNSPLAGLARIAGPALAAGDTLVVKPSALTSLSAFLVAELSIEIGLPSGVLNFVTGDASVGLLLAQHSRVGLLAFSGSSSDGRELRRAAAPSGKRLALELGGRTPVIVFEGADQDSAVEDLVELAWSGPNDACSEGTRLFVQESIANAFCAKLGARLAKLRVGDALDPSVDLGPLISRAQLERLRERLREAAEDGAKLRQPSALRPSEGFFHPPTLVTEVGPASRILEGELAGPVVVALTFRTPSEAIALSNNAPSGASASLWTRDLGLALELATRLDGEAISINGARPSVVGVGFAQGCGRDSSSIFLKSSEPRHGGRDSHRAARGDGEVDSANAVRPTKHTLGGVPRIARAPRGHSPRKFSVANRQDVRRAVDLARAAFEGWSRGGADRRARVLDKVARAFADGSAAFVRILAQATGLDPKLARREVESAIELAFGAAAWADKYEGSLCPGVERHFALSIVQPLGAVAILCPDEPPLLPIAALALPAVAMGNTVIVVPSPAHPQPGVELGELVLSAGLPPGSIHTLTGDREALALAFAEHDDVDALWYAGPPAARPELELAAAVDAKRTWMLAPRGNLPSLAGVLRAATETKQVGLSGGS